MIFIFGYYMLYFVYMCRKQAKYKQKSSAGLFSSFSKEIGAFSQKKLFYLYLICFNPYSILCKRLLTNSH